MSTRAEQLTARVQQRFADKVRHLPSSCGEVTFDVDAEHLLDVARALRDEDDFRFEILIDVCGVDFLDYGQGEWETYDSTDTGYSRGVQRLGDGRRRIDERPGRRGRPWQLPRFAAVYHLLSIARNQRLRLRVFCPDDDAPILDSVAPIWASANWAEREAFDLFGILFRNHPDLRRILTDYGFIGHPFRKDFPLIGNVEVRYDPEKGRVVYQPVTIEPRTLVPKVIRDDHRYERELVKREPGDE